jgi:hypothetical protein
MSPPPGIKFSHGPGPQVKAFLLQSKVNLKIVALKLEIEKFQTGQWLIFKDTFFS